MTVPVALEFPGKQVPLENVTTVDENWNDGGAEAFASKELYTGANKVTLTAIDSGEDGDDITITVLGTTPTRGDKTLAYSETGKDMSLQLAASAAVKAHKESTISADPVATLYFEAAAGGVAGNFDVYTYASDGLDVDEVSDAPHVRLGYQGGATPSTLNDMVAYIAANATKITASVIAGGDVAMSTIEAGTAMAGGTDSAITSTTAEAAAEIDGESSLVGASGGSTGLASAVSKANLTGGDEGGPIELEGDTVRLDVSLTEDAFLAFGDTEDAPTQNGLLYAAGIHTGIKSRGKYLHYKNAVPTTMVTIGVSCWVP
jgi:hypothetical protein